VDGQRFVIPGDWATVDTDGTVTLIGRGSECINTGGEKVFPEEVEIALKSCEAVNDAVVVGLPDAKFGQTIVALVEQVPDGGATADELVGHVRGRIAAYKAPRRIVFVAAIPRLPNGKADLTSIRATLLADADAAQAATAASP